MEYIRRSSQAGCFLCEAFQAEEDVERLIIKRGRTCAVIMNRYPYNNGHLMVAPYRHADSIESLDKTEHLEIMALASQACGRLRTELRAQGFNIGINQGAAAGAGLRDHLHLHVLPRWEGDTNFMPALANVKIIPQPLEEVYQLLRRDWS